MSFNGSGVFNRVFGVGGWATDKTNLVPVTASRVDSEMDGMATGLSTCICKDGQTTVTARIPFVLGVQWAVGSVSSPSANFTGDADTGIYSPGSDQVAIAAAGTQRFLVNAGAISVTGTFAVSGAATLSSTLNVTPPETFGSASSPWSSGTGMMAGLGFGVVDFVAACALPSFPIRFSGGFCAT